jgi:hypothetical protein
LMVEEQTSIADLKQLLEDDDLRKRLGKNWLQERQEEIVEEQLGDAPPETLKKAPDIKLKRQLQVALVRKGPLSPEVKKLREALHTEETPNPDFAAWQEKRQSLLGTPRKLKGEMKVWWGGVTDPYSVASQALIERIGECAQHEAEAESNKLAEKMKKQIPESYSKWVNQAVFGGKDTVSGWQTTKDGRVIFLGTAEQVKTHLGVPVKNLVKRDDLVVGYRYWGIDNAGRLTPPMHGANSPWAPGVNEAKGWGSSGSGGLYAFAHQGGKQICCKDYFDIHAGTHGAGGKRVMISACAMWQSKKAWGTAIRSRWAAPAVFLLLDSDTKAWKEKVHDTAKLYHARVAPPEKMYEECLAWVKEDLTDF